MPLPPLCPRPALADHPEFAMMLAVALERFHCTLGEVREDYWNGRLWRALTQDPVLKGRVARGGVATVLLIGPDGGPPPGSEAERERWRLYTEERIIADLGRSALELEVGIKWAEGRLTVTTATVKSIIAQAVEGDPRWHDLGRYAGDLSAVVIPVASAVGAGIAARTGGQRR
jgi:hypothetical protein